MMFAAFSWAHTPLSQKMRAEATRATYKDSNWDKTLGVQEWQLTVHHAHLMVTQRAVWSNKSDTDSHCPLVVTIRSARKSGQRTRGLQGLKKRDERQIQRKGGKGKDKSGSYKGKTHKGKNRKGGQGTLW